MEFKHLKSLRMEANTMSERNGKKEKGLSDYGTSESVCKEIDRYNTPGKMHPVMNISRKISMIFLTIALTFILCAAPTANAESDMENGLIAYFPFDGDAKDVSGNGNHGIEAGSVTYTEGAVGLAATFGGNGFIEAVGNPFTLEEWTISFWLYIEELPQRYWYSIVCKEAQRFEGIQGNYNYAFIYYYNGWFDSQYESCSGDNDDHMMHPGRPLSPGQWHHIVSTLDFESNYRIYLNGNLAGTRISPDIPCTDDPDAPFLIGGQVTDMTFLFKGRVDELRVYGLAHNAEFINELYTAPAHIPSEIPVDLDIKPGSCTNPVNIRSNGVLPAAVLGSEDLDVTRIDPASIRLAGVAPLRSSLKDVAGPDGCDDSGDDGHMDLTLKFAAQDIVKALGDIYDGKEVVLSLTGALNDGALIQGEDIVRVLKKGKKK